MKYARTFAMLSIAVISTLSATAHARTLDLGYSMGGNLDAARASADNIAGDIYNDGLKVRITGDRGSAAALMVVALRGYYNEAREDAAYARKLWPGKAKKGHPFSVCAKPGVKLYFHKLNTTGLDANARDTVQTWANRMGAGKVKVWNKDKPIKGVLATNYFPACK